MLKFILKEDRVDGVPRTHFVKNVDEPTNWSNLLWTDITDFLTQYYGEYNNDTIVISTIKRGFRTDIAIEVATYVDKNEHRETYEYSIHNHEISFCFKQFNKLFKTPPKHLYFQIY